MCTFIEVTIGDITKLDDVDAIVNAANSHLKYGGGVDKAIHRAAGSGLQKACDSLNGCKVGEAKITDGYGLMSRYVIHAVGPKWIDGKSGEEKLLESAYRGAQKIAVDHGVKSIAFPAISTGRYGYPEDQAASIALQAATQFAYDFDSPLSRVVFVLQDEASYQVYLNGIQELINKGILYKREDLFHDRYQILTPADFDRWSTPPGGSAIEIIGGPAIGQKWIDELNAEIEERTNRLRNLCTNMPTEKGYYNRYDIDWLINEVKGGKQFRYVTFWKADPGEENNVFSQWYWGEPFVVNGREYANAEQYMMSEKALLYNDMEKYTEIMNAPEPWRAKSLGREVKISDWSLWNRAKRSVLFHGNVAKMQSDVRILDALLETGDAILVEASPKDDMYGTGLSKSDLLNEDGTLKVMPWDWHKINDTTQAKNILGFVLMGVRDLFHDLMK